jgi:mycoredoxin
MGRAVTLYTTTWCGYCHRLKRQMDEVGIAYREIDVEAEPEYGARIVAATGGPRTVPTVEIGGRLLINPPIDEVSAAVES